VRFALPIITLLREGKIGHALLLTLVGALFIINMVFVVVSRTPLLTLPVMLAVFAMAHLKWRTNVLLLFAAVIFGALAWTVSRNCRQRQTSARATTGSTRNLTSRHGSGLRLEFWGSQ
jgi:hypothetical protein